MTSATVLVQRALSEEVAIARCGGAFGAVSIGGVAAHQRKDIESVIFEAYAITPDEWAADPDVRVDVRDAGLIVAVDPGSPSRPEGVGRSCQRLSRTENGGRSAHLFGSGWCGGPRL